MCDLSTTRLWTLRERNVIFIYFCIFIPNIMPDTWHTFIKWVSEWVNEWIDLAVVSWLYFTESRKTMAERTQVLWLLRLLFHHASFFRKGKRKFERGGKGLSISRVFLLLGSLHLQTWSHFLISFNPLHIPVRLELPSLLSIRDLRVREIR